MLQRPPWVVDGVAMRAENAAERVAVPVQLRRVVYPFRPEGQGATAF
jgi:hypothetical protein